jgi:hypothetical protein
VVFLGKRFLGYLQTYGEATTEKQVLRRCAPQDDNLFSFHRCRVDDALQGLGEDDNGWGDGDRRELRLGGFFAPWQSLLELISEH